MTASPSGNHSALIWSAAFAVLCIGLTVVVRRSHNWGDDSPLDAQGFQLTEAPKTDSSGQPGYVSKFEEEALQRGGGLAGFVPEQRGKLRAPGTVVETRIEPGVRESAYTLEREREAIRRLDPAIRQEQARLRSMTARYSKRYKVVRDVDGYFFSLPRYKTLYAKYNKDRNLFSFFRGAVTLPEVRTGIKKYMMNPEAMKVGMMMLAEGLGQPIPKPVMQETFTFLNEDHDMSLYMGSEFWPGFTSQMPAALADASLPPSGQGAIQNLTSALSGSMNVQSPPPAAGKR